MRHILRRYVTRDQNGRPLAIRFERVTDDENGNLQLTSEQVAHRCTGCNRSVADLADMRGTCDWCHRRSCCDRCASRCQVCSRQLCGRCRHGFAGPPVMTVCAVCHERLLLRQRREDQRAEAEAAFAQRIDQQRFLTQVESTRLGAERARLAMELQAARLGLRPYKPPFLKAAADLVGRAAVGVFRHVRNLLP